MHSYTQLKELLRKLPGIGTRQAGRFAEFLLRQDASYINDLVRSLEKTRNDMRICQRSGQLFFSSDNHDLSPLERDSSRDDSILMVVATDKDLDVLESSRIYTGRYFVLGGLVPLVSDVLSGVRSSQLVNRIKESRDQLSEVVLSFSFNPEGEHTRRLIELALKPLLEGTSIRVTHLGRGLSTGTELEYSDTETLLHAFRSREE